MAYVEGEFDLNGNNGTHYVYPPYNNGFGGFGWGGNNNHTYQATNDIESSIHNALDTLQITNKLDGITTDLNTDFGNVINAITTNGYENRLAMNDLGYQMQNCCCDLRTNVNQVGYNIGTQLADLKYTIATEECATRQASADNTQRIIDFMTQEKLASLTAENSALRGELSQQLQTSNIVNALRPTPVPAYPASNLYGYMGNACGCNGTSLQ